MNTIVILDSGHTCDTLGKCSPDRQIREWEYCQRLVRHIKSNLEFRGITVHLSHPEPGCLGGSNGGDLDIRVARANAIARAAKANGQRAIFVSVHLNASNSSDRWDSASGFMPFVGTRAGSSSRRLAQIYQKHSDRLGLRGNRWVPPMRYHTANFYVLNTTNCPAVLTENLFMTNRHDAAFLLSTAGFDTLVRLHTEAITEYVEATT